MKRSRFKLRITLWFSLALLMMCLLMGAVVISLYRIKTENNVLDHLQIVVNECAEVVEDEPDLQEILKGSEADELESSAFLQDEVFLMIYGEDQSRICGLFLYDEDEELPLYDYQIQNFRVGGLNCCLYDRYIHLDGGGLWIRGLAYSGTDLSYIIYTLWDVFLIFPVILAAALIGGYWLAGRFLKPVSAISSTAEKIRKNGDLTRRIAIGDTGDEISALAKTFNAMFDRLEENFEAEKQFSSNASHELRTPVAVILAQCEYALTDASGEDELREALRVVQRQGYRISQLIETLLILTRIEQGTGDYPMEETDISILTESICTDRSMIPEHGIVMETQIVEGIHAEINPGLYQMMLENLLQNAYRYGSENGSVCVSLTRDGSDICLRVKDNGIGIEEQDLPHIWERFYRAEHSRRKKGVGLGLSLVWQIVQYHKGNIAVSSIAGKETEFCVVLPVGL